MIYFPTKARSSTKGSRSQSPSDRTRRDPQKIQVKKAKEIKQERFYEYANDRQPFPFYRLPGYWFSLRESFPGNNESL